MKAACAILLMFAAMSSPAFAIDVPVYPGAKSSEMLAKTDRASLSTLLTHDPADARMLTRDGK